MILGRAVNFCEFLSSEICDMFHGWRLGHLFNGGLGEKKKGGLQNAQGGPEPGNNEIKAAVFPSKASLTASKDIRI